MFKSERRNYCHAVRIPPFNSYKKYEKSGRNCGCFTPKYILGNNKQEAILIVTQVKFYNQTGRFELMNKIICCGAARKSALLNITQKLDNKPFSII